MSAGGTRPIPRLHLIGPLGDLALDRYVEVATAAAAGGVDAVHVRLPDGRTDEMLWLARSLRARIGTAALIVNDRLDIAQLVQAAGVQLGERSFQVADARLVLDEHVIVGRSIHDLEGALGAAEAGADYLLAGHIFDTPSKAGTPGRGLDWLAEVTASVATPVIALGGITRERIPQVLEAGAHGVAVGRELLQAGNTSAAAAQARGLLA